jgi:hypothetical protein
MKGGDGKEEGEWSEHTDATPHTADGFQSVSARKSRFSSRFKVCIS